MIIIHGDNQVESRNFLSKLTALQKEKEIVRIEGKEISIDRLKQELENNNLFGKEKFVVIENLLSQSSSQPILSYLIKTRPKNLVIWENKEINSNKIRQLKAEEKLFKLPPIIFKFLDSLLPENGRQSLRLMKQAIIQSSPENVFYMLARQVRYLIIAHELGLKGLSELHPFQQQKIATQAKKFNLSQLLIVHRKLLYIDWQQKTGKTPFDLSAQLDLLIASL